MECIGTRVLVEPERIELRVFEPKVEADRFSPQFVEILPPLPLQDLVRCISVKHRFRIEAPAIQPVAVMDAVSATDGHPNGSSLPGRSIYVKPSTWTKEGPGQEVPGT